MMIIRTLDLEPGTCGFMRESRANQHGAVLYFLITPERAGHVHRLSADQMYHYYSGAPLDVGMLTADDNVVRHTLGPFTPDGSTVPQLLIPAGTIHGARTRGAFTLACTTSFSDERPVASDPEPDERSAMAEQGFQ
jgi:predicted cupin superfamily sugar epimerase